MYCKPEPRWLVQDPRYAPYCFLIAFETNQNQGGLFRVCTILFSIVFETNHNQDGLFIISDTVSTLFCFLITFESSQNQDSLFRIFTFLCSNCICNKPESMWLVQDIHYLVFLLHSKQTNTKLACSESTLFCFLIAFETNQNRGVFLRTYTICLVIAFETNQCIFILFTIYTICPCKNCRIIPFSIFSIFFLIAFERNQNQCGLAVVRPTRVYLLGFFCFGIQFCLLLSLIFALSPF